jgi:hypothetical protein
MGAIEARAPGLDSRFERSIFGGVLLGIALGVLIGLLTGMAFELLMDAARTGKDTAALLKVVTALLAIPGTWFGGGWLTGGSILKDVDVTEIRSVYVFTVMLVFTPFVLWEVYKRIAVGGAGAPSRPDA